MTSFGVESSGGTLFAESLMPNRAKAPLSVLVVSAAQVFILAQVPPPPPTPRDNVREVIHGVEIVDPYRWLEDQDGPQTREWIAAQNSYTRSLLNPLPMRERIYERSDGHAPARRYQRTRGRKRQVLFYEASGGPGPLVHLRAEGIQWTGRAAD